MANTTVTTQRISQLSSANAVGSADTFPFLQANSSTTKSVNVAVMFSAFTVPGANVYSGTINASSNDTSDVVIINLPANINFGHVELTAADITSGDYTRSLINFVADPSTGDVSSNSWNTSVGNNNIQIDGIWSSSNNVALKFNRASNATSNVVFNYVVSVV